VRQLIGVVLATTGDIQLTVAGRTPIAQLVDTYPLGRDANPGEPGPGQLLSMPERIEIIAGSDVLPLHDHGAVEVELRAGFAHHYAGHVGHILGEYLARGAIASGRAREVELLLHIAAPLQFTLGGKEWIGVVQVADWGSPGGWPGIGPSMTGAASNAVEKASPRMVPTPPDRGKRGASGCLAADESIMETPVLLLLSRFLAIAHHWY